MSNEFSENKSFVEEYDLYGKVYPYHDELQQAIPDTLEKYFENQNTSSLRFLDIGAGYGFTTKLVAEKFPQAHFILNEFDRELLAKSDEYLKTFSIEKLIGDVEDVIKKVPDQSLDAVYSAWVLHNFPPNKRAIVMKEIARVLKSGGVFVGLDKVGNINEQRTKDLVQTIIELEPFVSRYNRPDLYLEWIKHELRDEEPDRIFTDDENEQYFRENGFTWEYVLHILFDKVFIAIKK
jgi:ubiquinone/menaquinone biosynthesis C-methylase UbiE